MRVPAYACLPLRAHVRVECVNTLRVHVCACLRVHLRVLSFYNRGIILEVHGQGRYLFSSRCAFHLSVFILIYTYPAPDISICFHYLNPISTHIDREANGICLGQIFPCLSTVYKIV